MKRRLFLQKFILGITAVIGFPKLLFSSSKNKQDKLIKIHVLHCGRVRVDEALPFHKKPSNRLAPLGFLRSSKHQIWLPVSAYLIEHPKGLVLIDTGWHTNVRKLKEIPKRAIAVPELLEGQAIHEQLDKLGYKPSDLDYVFLSHMHGDHAGGLKLVRGAKKILTSNLEMRDTEKHKMYYSKSAWEGVNVETFSFNQAEYGHEKLAYDVFDDQTLIFVNTPGHTNGQSSTIIQNNGKFVLLCADTAYAKKSWEQQILPGIRMNTKKAKSSLVWVEEMSEQPNCVKVLANHDPDVKPQIIEL